MEKQTIDKNFGSIMVIVPHQDDEILMTAGILYQAAVNKLPVTVVMVTNGDCDCPDYTKGRTRLLETLAGVSLLGITSGQVIFLGYADTGMAAEKSFLMHIFEETDSNKVYPSSCGSVTYALEEKAEFHMEIMNQHADYCRAMLMEDLKQVIKVNKPENIFTTSEFDMHGDHEALCKFVYEVLDELKSEADSYEPHVYCGLVHSCAGDDKWPLPETSKYSMPEGLERTKANWEERIVFSVPEVMKRSRGTDNLKYQALLKYETALEPSAYDFLMAFIKDEEFFWKIQ